MGPLSASSLNRRRWAAAAGGAVVVVAGLLTAQAHSAPKPESVVSAGDPTVAREELADYDSRDALNAARAKQPAVATKSASVAVRRLAAAVEPGSPVRKLRDKLGMQGVVEMDRATGTPRRVAKIDGFLTGVVKNPIPTKIALDYVKANSAVFGLNATEVGRLKLRRDYVDVAGTHHLSFVQSVGGVPVFGNGVKAHVAKDGRLIQVDGSPVAELPGSPGRAKLSAEKARAAAVQNVFGDSSADVVSRAAGVTTFSDQGSAKLVMFQTAAGPRLAWQTVAMDEGWIHVIDAADGTVLFRQSMVAEDASLVWPNYPGAPSGGQQVTVDLARWLPNGSPRLAGNIAHVYTDINDDNRASPSEEVRPTVNGTWRYWFTDFSAQVGGKCSAVIKCSWNPAVPYSWRKNRSQSSVELYYLLGVWHDHLAANPIGFGRAAGNFEAIDDDAVQAEALDGANTDNGLPDSDHISNANMSTPPDGTAPRMQMYLWGDPTNPDDESIAGNSSDEADTVFHEYTHGLSNRLVVDANGVSTLTVAQSRAMGEAWSDWYTQDYFVAKGYEKDTAKEGDVLVGKYMFGGATLRSEPMDCQVGSTSRACPGTPTAGPGGYTYGDYGKIYSGGPDVHTDGEIWAQTLWDLRKAIGSAKARFLVTRAMELSPAKPSFLDQRNSILQADRVTNGGRLQATIWKVFARRGMGYFAGAMDGTDTDVVEDFSLPPAANTPRGTVTGTVTDDETGAVVAGATVTFSGHTSGFANDYVTTTAADGTYRISRVLPGTYPKVFASAAGYDSGVKTISVGARTNGVDWALRRDWAATSGGSSVDSFTGPDFTTARCGPKHLFDQSYGTGWGSEVTDPTGYHVVVKLPQAVDITELTLDATATCGDAGSASTGLFRIETSPDGTTWTVAANGQFTAANRNLANPVPLTAGTTDVRYLRYTMLSSQAQDLGVCATPDANYYSGCSFMDSTELAVYGTPS
ncbi:F5/8 type C domain-containing protein [Krasilnikovia cinnamomea]|uniref:F5/8 type C domain-containing protein n=1 Tax=Krasilnikovia cinnamomea TaxID=349313 RepID=A0A4Q7ZTI3_9ACTN|nr:M36 family metallopeptidase [Krasilnikovia cinnamomea]RZU53849.1 F5/8 type C domain-containing protein [Krasilnikovia cinnamomea]